MNMNLMLGNYFNHKHGICKVISIDRESCCTTMADSITDDEEAGTLDPIKLTEEWLLNFGFEKNELKTVTYWKLHHFKLIKGLKRSGYPFHLVSNIFNVKPVMYVHELQNLHFTLIGEELKIKNYESNFSNW